jgi:hypothetical protein
VGSLKTKGKNLASGKTANILYFFGGKRACGKRGSERNWN